jgi:AcrR family transcriptional regulator
MSTPGPRPRFTVDEVLAAALGVIDTGPAEAFTMRRVAVELGIGVMTLYGYVASKEELLEGATLLAFAQAHVESSPKGSWDERLRHEVRGFHALARRHPHLVTLVLAQRAAAPGLFRMRERMVDALLSAGFDGASALRALGVLLNYTLGFASAQAGAAPIDLPERIRELPADQFPRLSELASCYDEHLSDEAFESGLEWLILGLSASLPS